MFPASSRNPNGPVPLFSDFAEFPGVRFADRVVTLRVKYSAIRDLRVALGRGSPERLGLVFGSSAGQTLTIDRCEPLILAGNPRTDHGAFRAALCDFRGGGAPPIGFFRTQLRREAEMSLADEEMLADLRHVTAQPGVFLVIEASRARTWSAVLFGLSTDTHLASREPLLEFPFDEGLFRKKPQGLGDLPPEPPAPLPSSLEFPQGLNLSRRFKFKKIDFLDPRVWILSAILLGSIFGIAVAFGIRPAGQQSDDPRGPLVDPLALSVNQIGNQLEISWDRTSNVVQRASDGTITIHDGDLTKVVKLDPSQLREGKILYTPLFRELSVKIDVSNNHRRIEGESVQILGWDTGNLTEVPASDSRGFSDPKPFPDSKPFSDLKPFSDPVRNPTFVNPNRVTPAPSFNPSPRVVPFDNERKDYNALSAGVAPKSDRAATPVMAKETKPAPLPNRAPTTAQSAEPKPYIRESARIEESPSEVTVLPRARVRTPPPAPSNLQATILSPTQVNLTWTNNASDAIAVDVELRSPSGILDLGQAFTITSTGVSNLQPGVTYTFRVRTENNFGYSPYSNYVTVVTK